MLDTALELLKEIKVGEGPNPNAFAALEGGDEKAVVAVDEPLEMTENTVDVPGAVLDDP